MGTQGGSQECSKPGGHLSKTFQCIKVLLSASQDWDGSAACHHSQLGDVLPGDRGNPLLCYESGHQHEGISTQPPPAQPPWPRLQWLCQPQGRTRSPSSTVQRSAAEPFPPQRGRKTPAGHPWQGLIELGSTTAVLTGDYAHRS